VAPYYHSCRGIVIRVSRAVGVWEEWEVRDRATNESRVGPQLKEGTTG
jgi:hypothetical protein